LLLPSPMRAFLLVTCVLAAACADDSTPDGDNSPDSPTKPDQPSPQDPAPAADVAASDCAAPAREYGGWNHDITSPIISAAGDPYHGASDVIAVQGGGAHIEAKFVYGLVLKDLEGENVDLYLAAADCSWEYLGKAVTDDDGIATLSLDTVARAPGRYAFEFVVRGDDSRARGTLWVMSKGRDLAVFDLDGTLTTGDDELIEEILLGDDATMMQDSDALVDTYLGEAYQPVYLTGRPVYFSTITREWLASHRLPEAPLLLTSGLQEGLFSVEDFKRETLLDLSAGLELDLPYAFGNATTDICAYADAGIDPASTFIIGKNGGLACEGYAATVAVTSYGELLQTLDLAPAKN